MVATKEGAAEIDFGRSDSGRKLRIATPGKLTSATLAMKLFLAENNAQVELQDIPFDQIQTAVIDGDFDAGVIIHEGQITHQRENLVCVLDLGEWWWSKHALPLPLGVNVVRKELGEQAMRASYRALKASIETSLAERSAALDYALGYGRGITPSEADQFVGMYVNELTVDMGSEGRRSIELFLNEAAGQGIIDEVPVLEYVDDNSLG